MRGRLGLEAVVQRIRHGDFHRAAGRFYCVRCAYSAFQSRWQRLRPDFHAWRLKIREKSVFEDASVDGMVKGLREDGIGLGLRMPQSLVGELYQHADSARCWQPGVDGTFLASEVRAGRTVERGRIAHGMVHDLTPCEAIDQVARDPVLLQIVRKYLKYWPTRIEAQLTWVFPTDRWGEDVGELYRPIRYHYDVHGLNFVSAFFYLTDASNSSGAHAMIKGSHRKKPLSMVLHGGR